MSRRLGAVNHTRSFIPLRQSSRVASRHAFHRVKVSVTKTPLPGSFLAVTVIGRNARPSRARS
ncbi:MAG: hypothetical protein ACRDGD_00590 [Candidatus Limnocylindria bacterium]